MLRHKLLQVSDFDRQSLRRKSKKQRAVPDVLASPANKLWLRHLCDRRPQISFLIQQRLRRSRCERRSPDYIFVETTCGPPPNDSHRHALQIRCQSLGTRRPGLWWQRDDDPFLLRALMFVLPADIGTVLLTVASALWQCCLAP